MAVQIVLAQVTVPSLSPIARFGGSVPECGRLVVAVQRTGNLHGALQHAAAAARPGLSKRTHNRVIVARAEQTNGGDASTATTTVIYEKPAETGGITEVDKDSFWPLVKSAGEKLVVLDMYTQWCGPCKLMLPKLQALAASMDDVIFCKLDCNQDNKSLAKELGIKVVPTFKIFKADTLVTTITGAKYDDLVKAIESARSGK